MDETFAQAQYSKRGVDRDTDEESIGDIEDVIGRPNYDHIGVLVGHFTECSENFAETIVAVLFDHLEVRQGELEEELSGEEVEEKKDTEHFHEHDEILLRLLLHLLFQFLSQNAALLLG